METNTVRKTGAEASRRPLCLVYLTAPDPETADRIAAELVETRLAACVNILGPIRSVYRWEGRIERGGEIALLAKTACDRLDDLSARVREIHPYDCPCVVAIPVLGGDPAFLAWLDAETGPRPDADALRR